MELLDPRLNPSNVTTFECQFSGPDLVDFVSSSIVPTFAIEPTNTATLDVTGTFTLTDLPGQPCYFPTYSAYTPVITQIGGTASFTCDPLTLANSYTGITCQDVTWNQLPTGTYQLAFNSANPGATSLVANTFVIIKPTTVTSTVYEDATASTTLLPLPTSTASITSTTSVETISSTPSAVPSSTVFETVFSTIIVSVSTSTPAPLSTETVNEYTSTEISTVYLSANSTPTVTVSVESCSNRSATLTSSTLSTSSSTVSTAPTASCVHWAEYATSEGATYTLMCSSVMVGEEVSKSYEENFESCAAECEKFDNCIAFSWAANKKCRGGTCSLLSAVESSVSGSANDVTGTRIDIIKLPKRKVDSDRFKLRDAPELGDELQAREVEHCTTCHPDHTLTALPTTTSTVSVVVTTETITPDASGVSTDIILVGATTTEIEATPTSGVITETVTTDTTSLSTTTLAPTITTFTASLVATIVTTITPPPVNASTVTVTYCHY